MIRIRRVRVRFEVRIKYKLRLGLVLQLSLGSWFLFGVFLGGVSNCFIFQLELNIFSKLGIEFACIHFIMLHNLHLYHIHSFVCTTS